MLKNPKNGHNIWVAGWVEETTNTIKKNLILNLKLLTRK